MRRTRCSGAWRRASRGLLRQAPARVRSVSRHRRFRDRHERREGEADRPEARREDVSPAHRLSRAASRRRPRGSSRRASRAADRGRGPGHARQSPSSGASRSRSSRCIAAPRIRTKLRCRRHSRCPAHRGPAAHGGKLTVEIQHKATGRRKTSMARVRLVPGTGAITINARPLDDYFPNNVLKMIIKQPLLSVGGGGEVRHSRSGAGRRNERPGRCDPPRHFPRPDRVQRGAPQEAEEGRLPDARSADEGTQEVRPARRAGPVPVQQAVESRVLAGSPAEMGGVSWSRSR